MILLAPILNRAADGKLTMPEDGWYHIIPKGEFVHPETKTIQIIDDASVASIMNHFKQDAAKPNFRGLLVDQEHFSYDPNKSSEAFGWIKELQDRADGVWGRVPWTPDLGEPAVKNGRYAYISPVWWPHECEKLDGNRIRPLRLDTAGLTNSPNLKGMVPLSNRAGAVAPADKETKHPKTNMKSVATKLGLSAEASEEAILAAVTSIMNRATTAEEAAKPLTNRITALEKENKTLLDAQVETDLKMYANRFKPEMSDKWKARLIANRASAIELLEEMDENKEAGHGPVLNRASASTPAGKTAAGDPAALARQAHSEVEEYRMANRCTYEQAVNVIRNRKPQLFGLAK